VAQTAASGSRRSAEPADKIRRAFGGWRRILWAVALALSAAPALPAQRYFDVPAGPATQTVTRFAQQAGVPVLFPYALLQNRSTRALRGRYEVHEGLQRLLRGSGLVASVSGRGQLTIRLADPPPSAPEEPRPEPSVLRDLGENEALPEVEVTGTRLARDGMTTPTPVAALSRVELDELGPTTLMDALAQLPHFLNNDTPQTQSFGTSGAAGASYLNLRGIGTIRTLVLLDGRRLVPSTRFGTVDVALFPRSLVERVEVVTGGASASYGSDAVSGVVNVILDRDFTGLRTHAQAGLADAGDFGNFEAGVTFGTRLGGNSSLLLSGEVFRADGIRGYNSRSWYRGQAAIPNPDPGGPAEIIVENARATTYTFGGLITSGPLAGIEFLEGGVPAPFQVGEHYTRTAQSGGSGGNPADEHVWLLPDQERLSAFARFTTRPTSATSAFLQVLAGRTRNSFGKEPPALWGAWEATIYDDNAFLPESIRGEMAALGVTSFRFGRAASRGELGNTSARLGSALVTATAGGEWHLPGWSLEGYYQYGRNHSVIDYDEIVRLDRVYRALDSVIHPGTGEPVCRSTLAFPDDGCVPLNLFGPWSVSPEARAWIIEGDTRQVQDVEEQVAELTVRGDTPWRTVAPVSVAAGVSWRREAVDAWAPRHPSSLEGLTVPPAETQGYRGLPAAYVNNDNIFERTSLTTLEGSYDVHEVFGEALVPLLRSLPPARRLDLHLAVRGARYSGSGTIGAWRTGLDWEVLPSLRLRATRSRDIRAGSHSDRYDFSSVGITIVDRVLENDPIYAVVGDRRGNPQIEPERADTTTAGIVLRPGFAPGLSLATDYYDIKVHDAIALYGVQNIIDGCAGGDANLCALIERDEENGLIRRVNNVVLNIAGARSRGIDLELSYRRAVDWFGGGTLALRLFANRTLESSTTNALGTRIDRAGQTGLFGGAPRFQSNLSLAFERGPLRVAVQQRYISSGSYDATYGPGDIDRRRVRPAAYTGAQVSWRPPGLAGTRMYFNVQNLFDEDPPIAPDWGFGGSIPTNEGLFDVLGRRIVFGLRYER
jgi:iron complex outermembrane receptor protein